MNVLEFDDHPVRGRHLRTSHDVQNLIRRPNTSTWMLNIGTHRKPYNDDELQFYAESLRRAIENVFDDEDNLSEMYYRVTTSGTEPRTFQTLTAPALRTRQMLGIDSVDWTSVVETGSKTGRIDAHILLHVIHSNTLIRVDINNFADLLQEALMEENETFANLNLMRQEPGQHHKPLAWPAEGRPYVSFRSIGRFNEEATVAYMTKQFKARIFPEEFDALTTMTDHLAGNINIRTGAPTYLGNR